MRLPTPSILTAAEGFLSLPWITNLNFYCDGMVLRNRIHRYEMRRFFGTGAVSWLSEMDERPAKPDSRPTRSVNGRTVPYPPSSVPNSGDTDPARRQSPSPNGLSSKLRAPPRDGYTTTFDGDRRTSRLRTGQSFRRFSDPDSMEDPCSSYDHPVRGELM